jgi:GR25 family glycosyltransferase involved in LPS biosynthesis
MNKLSFFLSMTIVLGHQQCNAFPYDVVKSFNLKAQNNYIDGIDAIVFINLDKRVEKKTAALKQFYIFGIEPLRFPAINGWLLNQNDIDSSTQTYIKGMSQGRWASKLSANNPNKEYIFLDETCINNSVSSVFLTHGALGCFLSQLSIIKNAYESHLQTIWILEDDFKIVQNPRIISHLLEKLNNKIGPSNWDILFTDLDTRDSAVYYGDNDFMHDLKGLDLAWLWRPDLTPNPHKLNQRTVVDEDFIKIGSRMRTHSYILNRSGMQKILDFYKTRGLFAPYDHELALIPNLNLYSLKYDVVTFEETVSDTRGAP